MKSRYCECFKPMIDDLTLEPMLRIIYNKSNLKIRFDDNLLLNDPECNQYSSKQIIIGIKGMLSEKSEKSDAEFREMSGRVAQKFYNYTMLVVFKNKKKPYVMEESDIFKTKFEEISRGYRQKYRQIDLERYLNIFFKLNLIWV